MTEIADKSGYNEERRPYMPTLKEMVDNRSYFVQSKDPSITVKEVFSQVAKKIKEKELICDGTHSEIEWVMDTMNLITTWGGATKSSINKAEPFNIIYLRDDKINQFKTL